MEATVIDPLAFSLDVPALFEKLRIRAAHSEDVSKLVAEAIAVARPRVTYKLAFIEAKGAESVTADGITFTSRVLRVNLDALHRFFAFVGTAGRELEAWADSKQDVLTHFYADAINEAVLHAAMTTFAAQLTERFQLASTAVMNPGSLTRLAAARATAALCAVGRCPVGHRRRTDRQPADGPAQVGVRHPVRGRGDLRQLPTVPAPRLSQPPGAVRRGVV